ncbi:MAG: CopG family transcriptional regulator [Anaerolineales bacterium]|nr:MAG: CopG family transcriptional regulator [Anaerolineales bacterium]
MKRTQIQLTEAQFFELKNLSSSRNTSMAELIRQAVDSFLDSSPVISRDERKRRAIAAVGQFHSGLGDLAADHDRYLEGAYADDDDIH